MATSMSQICLDHLNCVVLILTCGSSLVVQGCVTAADCNVGQVCFAATMTVSMAQVVLATFVFSIPTVPGAKAVAERLVYVF